MKRTNKIWHIGDVAIEGQAVLAPMAGVSDLAYRQLAKEAGAALVCTEMVSAMGIQYKNENTAALLKMEDNEHPVSMQIFGSDPQAVANGAVIMAKAGADIVDINMGCPVKKVVSSGDGSALMKTPDLAVKVAAAAVEALAPLGTPLTVKLRLGWDEEHKNVVDMAKALADVGVAALGIHGRTREQMYNGKADWSYIARVVDAVDIPVMGNGDVVDGPTAAAMLEETDCQAVMIGRGAQGNPWVFHEVNHYLATGEVLPRPRGAERIAMLKKHFQLLCHYKGVDLGRREIRTHAGWYVKGLPGAAQWRQEINRDLSYEAITALIEAYEARLRAKA